MQRIPADASVPLHEVVKRQIYEGIVLGQWRPGDVLPSEVALAGTMGVAVGTVRRALLDLAAEGLLSRRRKTGTVVTGRTPHHSLRHFYQYFRLHRRDGGLVKSQARVLALEREPAGEKIGERLQMPAHGEVVRVDRLRLVEGRPVMRDSFRLAATRVPDFPTRPQDLPELLYVYLIDRYGIRISAVREQLGACLASDEDAALLQLDQPAAILTIDEVAFDQLNVPTIVGQRLASTRDFTYVNEVR